MIKAKKSLGQNFLIDKNILEKIINTANIENKTILEIGPGTGNLTSYILKKKPKKLFVIEKDNNLAANLENKFNNQLTIINDDVLKIDETTLFNDKVTVFGNLPYNISTEILSKWITNLKNNRKNYDVIIGMYHDQVLTPIKTLFEYDAINITLGLPFLRISPDHGPNEKMMGKNFSNPLSLMKAIQFLDKRWLKQKKV